MPPASRRSMLAAPAWAAAFVLATYVALYPIRGFRVPIGSDTPVYVWWARYAGASGIGGLGTRARPAVSGLLATLSRVTGIQVAGVAEAIYPVLAAVLALAAAALVHVSLGPDRRRFALVAVLTGSFLSLMVAGYLSTLAFGACFVAALPVLAERVEGPAGRALGAAAVLVGAAGLSHLLFLALAAAVTAGAVIALVPAALRDMSAGRPIVRTAAARVVAATAGGAGLAVAAFVAVGGGPPAPETSRDAVLRRAGLRRSLVASYRRKLVHDFPWFRAATTVVLACTPLVPAPHGRLGTLRRRWVESRDLRAVLFCGAMAAWLLISAGAVVALSLGIGAPGQRLAAFCIPLPIMAAIGLARLWPSRRLVAAAGALVFVVVGWLGWGGQRPLVTEEAVVQARAAGAALGRTPPGTPLVLVADDRSDKPALFLTRYANYVRDAVPAPRVPDVHLYVGTVPDFLAHRPSLTGQREHDSLALSSWAETRTLPSSATLAVAIEAFDADRFAEARALPGGRLLAPGVAALPGPAGSPCVADCPGEAALVRPGAGPLSPWLPAWLAPAMMILLCLVGFPWTKIALDGSDAVVRLALSPAFGLAALAVASIAADVVGLRLSGGGGWAALAVASLGWILSPLLRARAEAPGPRPRDQRPR